MMAKWSVMAGQLQLLILVAICGEMTHISRRSITRPMCRQDEYYDADRDMCFGMCGEYKCQPHQICSRKITMYTGTQRCVDLCFKTCASPLYCNITTAYCDLCANICEDQIDETLRQCRIYCYGVYNEIVMSRTSVAGSIISTSTDPTPTSDESVHTELSPVSKPIHLTTGEVAACMLIPVALCSLVALGTAFCIRHWREKRTRGETQGTRNTMSLMSNTPDLEHLIADTKACNSQLISGMQMLQQNISTLQDSLPSVIIRHEQPDPKMIFRDEDDEMVSHGG